MIKTSKGELLFVFLYPLMVLKKNWVKSFLIFWVLVKNTDLSLVTYKLYHIMLCRVDLARHDGPIGFF